MCFVHQALFQPQFFQLRKETPSPLILISCLDSSRVNTLLRLTSRSLSHSYRFRCRLRRLLLLLRFGRCLGRTGIFCRPSPPLLLSLGFSCLLFLLLWRRLFLLPFRFLLFFWRGSSGLGSPSRLLRLLLVLGLFGGFALVAGGFGGSLGFGGRGFGCWVGRFFFVVFSAIGVTGRCLFFHIELGLVLHNIVARASKVNGRVIGLGGLLDGVAAFGLDRHFPFVFLLSDFSGWGRAIPVPGGWACMSVVRAKGKRMIIFRDTARLD